MTHPSILITGASGGIGRATALRCASAGARIGIHYNGNRGRAEALLGELDGSGHHLFQADIGRADTTGRLIEEAEEAFGGLDVLVNNAGVANTENIAEMSFGDWVDSWTRTLDINLLGAAHLSFHAAQGMIRRGGGRIVNVSSRGAFRGEPRMPWYGASKAAMNAMGQSMAQALGPLGVQVYTVAPGFVETEMAKDTLASELGDGIRNQSPMGRVAKPEEIAETIHFLALHAPEFMTGSIIDVNGASYLRS